MLKLSVCGMLIFMSIGILNASESAGKIAVKKFWQSFNYCQVDTMKYITADFTALSQGRRKDRKQTETYIRLFNQYISLVKKQKYADALEAFRKLIDSSGVKVVKRDTRTFSKLSSKEQQQTIAFMKRSANSFPDKYTVRKNRSMKITSFSISGNQATAIISFQDILKSQTAKITLRKVNGKWLVNQIADK